MRHRSVTTLARTRPFAPPERLSGGQNRARLATLSFALAGLLLAPACSQQKTSTASQPAPASPASQPAKPASQPSGAADPHAGHDHGEEHAAEGASGKGTSPTDRDQVDPDGVIRRGVALTGAKVMTISEVVAGAATLNGKSVKLTGKVESVCERKGCWFVLQGDKPEETVRITAKDHAFYVPKSALGHTAIVEGPFELKTVDVGMAQHMEDERASARNEPRKTITEPVKELSIEAHGAELRAPGAAG